jgi:hypothetical protein
VPRRHDAVGDLVAKSFARGRHVFVGQQRHRPESRPDDGRAVQFLREVGGRPSLV